MAHRYKQPRCVAFLESGGVCNHGMSLLAERHPLTLHHRQNKVFVFHCGYCDAVQGVDEDKLDRYFEKV